MKTACKIRLDVDLETARRLDGQSKICNWLYNHLLEQANALRHTYCKTQDEKTGQTLYTKRGLRDLVPEMKPDHPFLQAVYSSPVKNAALRLSRAIQDYQKSRNGKRKGKPTGWPKFRAWKLNWFSLEYDEPWKGFGVEGQTLTLQFGTDKTGKRLSATAHLTEPLAQHLFPNVKTLRIIKRAGGFFAVFTVESNDLPLPRRTNPGRVIALDPNHKNFAYGVGTDGQAIEIGNLPGLKALDARIDELKARRDKCERKSKKITREDGSFFYLPSRRWTFFNDRLDRAYQTRRDQTKTYLFTVANQLFKRYDLVGVGDYAPLGNGITTAMRRAMNNRSLIGRFKPVLLWVAAKSGKQAVVYEEKGTTRTCHIPTCGYVVDGGIPLEVREWDCPKCGTHHLRDENAAQNGLGKLVEQNLLPRSGHTPVKITARWAWRVTPSGVRVSAFDVPISQGRDSSGHTEHCQEIKPEAHLSASDPVVACE